MIVRPHQHWFRRLFSWRGAVQSPVTDLHYMTPVVSMFISYTFLSLESLAEELEDPFGVDANDLPLNAICNTIEHTLRDMNNEALPPSLKPDARFNLI